MRIVETDALTLARRAEAAVMAGERVGPLHGVPFSVKDLLFTKGVRATTGSRIFRRGPGRPIRRRSWRASSSAT